MKFLQLSEVCAINMGQSPDSSSYNDTGDGLPFFQGNADFGDKHPVTRVWCSEPTKIARAGDILISVRAPIGAMNYAKETCCIGRGLAAITPDKKRVSPEFIFWLLKGKNAELNSKGTGSTFKAISRKVLEEVLVPDISLEQQSAYATRLETIYDIIQTRQRQLRAFDTLIKARFVEMFGGLEETVSLSDVAIVTGGLTKNADRKKLPLTMPYLRVANVSFANIDVSEMLTIGLTEEERQKTILHYGDLLFVEGNGSPDQIGRVAVWHDEIVPCVHQNHIIKARLDESKMQPTFAMYYFMSQRGREQIKRKAVSTSGLYTLSVSKIADFVLPCPPLSQQKEFSSFVSQVDKSKAVVQKALDKAQLLFDSLMQEYFG